jgi:hypothetical protein
MKLNTEINRLSENTLTRKSDFGIRDENTGDVIEILRKKMYSNAVLAVIREYMTNAFDAHVENNIGSTPILVTAPTFEDPVFKVRDYGKGLSAEQVREVYVQYGNSTKRDSNRFTGCLGIGCKAAFAYGDVFTIISYYNGVKYTWIATVAPGEPGSIALAQDVPCSINETGIEIQVSVKKRHLSDFDKEITKLVPYFTIKPDLIAIEVEDIEYAEEGRSWKLKKDADGQRTWSRNHGNAKAVMGNIAYPVDVDNMGSGLEENTKAILQCSHLVMLFEIGQLDIAASRESLEYTQRTIDSLNIEASHVLKDIAAHIQKTVDEASNHWNASMYAIETTNALPVDIQKSVLKQLRYKGKTVLERVKLPMVLDYWAYKHQYKNDIHQNSRKSSGRIPLKANIHICTYDADTIKQANATRRVRTLQDQDGYIEDAEYYMIPLSDLNVADAAKLGFISKKYLDEPVAHDPSKVLTAEETLLSRSTLYLVNDCIRNLDLVEPKKPKKSSRTLSSGERIKIEVCELKNASNITSQLKVIETDNLEETLVKEQHLDKYIYVPLDRFSWMNPPNTASLDPGNLTTYTYAAQCLVRDLTKNYELPIHIYGVKKAYLAKLHGDWMTLDQWFTQVYNQWVKKASNAYQIRLADLSGRNTDRNFVDDYEVVEQVYDKLAKGPPIEMHAEWKLDHDCRTFMYSRNTQQPELHTEKQDMEACHYYQIFRVAIDFNAYDYKTHESSKDNDWYKAQSALLKRWPLLQYITAPYHYGEERYGDLYSSLKQYLTAWAV